MNTETVLERANIAWNNITHVSRVSHGQYLLSTDQCVIHDFTIKTLRRKAKLRVDSISVRNGRIALDVTELSGLDNQ